MELKELESLYSQARKDHVSLHVMTPDGPASVLGIEGRGHRTINLTRDDAWKIGRLVEMAERGELEIGKKIPEELRFSTEGKAAMELDGMVEVEIHHMRGPDSIRFYRADELKFIGTESH